MDEEVSIKRVEADDLEKIRELALDQLREEYTIDLIQHFYENHQGCFISAKVGGKLAGFILAVPMDERALRILMLAVSEENKLKGIGSGLLSYASNYAVSRKMNRMVLEVGTDNKKAIDFYTKRGFKITGIINEYYRDRSDAFVMKYFIPM